MDKKLDLKDFDILGIIELNDVQGIEKYVTPIEENGQVISYLSRSKEYYNVKTMSELSIQRDELKTKLTKSLTKRNFVILENMLNCSAKVFFRYFEQFILSGKSPKYQVLMEQARKCLESDMKNIFTILEGKGEIDTTDYTILPAGTDNSLKRAVEMDNKAVLYLYAKALKMNNPENVEVLTPGYGSIYIGPMLKAMYGCDYTNMWKSKYITETIPGYSQNNLQDLLSNNRIFTPGKTIFLLDDNIGTGQTINEIIHHLHNDGINNILSGAIQFNWRNYYRVSTGQKRDIQRFNIPDFDFISPFNYAGHKLYEHAIDSLHSSGKDYVEYLHSKSYRKPDLSDTQGSIQRAIICAGNSGLSLSDEYTFPELDDKICMANEILPEYINGSNNISNPFARRIINFLIGKIMFPEKGENTYARNDSERS